MKKILAIDYKMGQGWKESKVEQEAGIGRAKRTQGNSKPKRDCELRFFFPIEVVQNLLKTSWIGREVNGGKLVFGVRY